MNRVFIHRSKNFDNLLKLLLGLLIPFAIFGLYKNGLDVYFKGYCSLVKGLYPLFYLGISIVVSIIYSLIFKEKFLSYNLLTNILIALVTIPTTNIFLYPILLVITNVITRYLKVNPVCLYMLLLILLTFILKDYTYLNLYEKSVEHIYVLLDYIIGKGTGGCGNTFLLMTFISFITLMFNHEYKKEVPITSLVTYYILLLISLIFTRNFDVNLFLNNNLLFAFIFIAPISIYSPYTKGAGYIYGTLIGLITFAFSFLDVSLGVYFSIFVLSFLSKYLDKFIAGK